MGWFRKKSGGEAELVGRWVIDPADSAALAAFGDVEAEFDASGDLRYLIKSGDKVEAILMTYRVEGDMLVTDQPSHPRPERTRFALDGDVLTLTLGGVSARFLKAPS